MIKKLLAFFNGYLVVEIKGNALERFVTQIINSGIELWSIEKINKNHYQAQMFMKDFNKLRPLIRTRLCRVNILKKLGLPSILQRIKKRSFLLMGMILFVFILYIGSSFLWFININGLKQLSQDRIYQVLDQVGVKPGVLKQNLDLKSVEDIILKEIPQISWINFNWEGTRLNIEIVEKKIVEETQTNKIVAENSGVITELIVLKGRATVKEGDTVTKGQTLIVPFASNKKDINGIVKANVWYEGYGTASMIKKEAVATGEVKTIWKVKYGQKIFKLPMSSAEFDDYEVKKTKKSLPEWRNISFPLELIKEKHKQVKFLTEKRDYDTALFLAKDRAFKNILEELEPDAIILDSKYKIIATEDNNKIKVRVLIKVEEDIAKKQ